MPDTQHIDAVQPPLVSLWPRFWVARVCDVYPIAIMQPERDDTVLIPWWESATLMGTAAPPTPLKGNHIDEGGEAGG